MHRRSFLKSSSALAASSLVAGIARDANCQTQTAKARKIYRAGIIGDTARGGYGHGLDVVWQNVPNVELVAVADPDSAGLAAAEKRLGVGRGYADYRQMLEREKLDVVSIGPRLLDQREAMVTACAAAGCHIFCEKPFAADAATADRMLAACKSHGVKVAVAHQLRIAPGTTEIHKMIADGRLGKILSLRARGKEDRRAGAEDTLVLGCHMFNLMNFLAGPPRWVASEVLLDGRPITNMDAPKTNQPLGPLVGNSIAAMFGFADGVTGYWESKSVATEAGASQRYALEIACTKGVAIIRGTFDQFLLPAPAFDPAKKQIWQPLGSEDWAKMKSVERSAHCNRLIAEDLLQAVEEDREPIVSGAAAAIAIEMVQSIYAAHLAGGRCTLPLTQRKHPLAS